MQYDPRNANSLKMNLGRTPEAQAVMGGDIWANPPQSGTRLGVPPAAQPAPAKTQTNGLAAGMWATPQPKKQNMMMSMLDGFAAGYAPQVHQDVMQQRARKQATDKQASTDQDISNAQMAYVMMDLDPSGREQLARQIMPQGQFDPDDFTDATLDGLILKGRMAGFEPPTPTPPEYREFGGNLYAIGPDGPQLAIEGERGMEAPPREEINGVLYERDPETGQWNAVASAPKTQEPKAGYRPMTQSEAMQYGLPDGAGYQVNTMTNQIERIPGFGDGGRAQAEFKDVMQLQGRFDNITSDYRGINDQMNVIETTAAQGTATGDLALVVAFTKLLDPGSVAREGEVALTQSAASLQDQATNWIAKLEQGNTLLPPQTRADLLQAAREMYGQYSGAYARLQDRYGQMADRYGMNREDVLVSTADPVQPRDGLPQWSGAVAEEAAIPDQKQEAEPFDYSQYLFDGAPITEDDIQATMEQTGWSRDRVLAELRSLADQ